MTTHRVSQVLQELAGTEPAGQANLENPTLVCVETALSLSACTYVSNVGVEWLTSTKHIIQVVLKDTMHTHIQD